MADKSKDPDKLADVVAATTERFEALGPEHDARIQRERERDEEREHRKRWTAVRAELLRRGLSVRHLDLVAQGVLKPTPSLECLKSFTQGEMWVLGGNVGCGKTVAAHVWLLGIETAAWTLPMAYSVRMVTAAWFARKSRYHDDKIDTLARVRRLVIDDIGVEYLDDKGSFLTDFDELIDLRWRAGLSTIITTNLKMDDFRKRYKARIADRIRDCGGWKNVGRESMRASE